MTGALCLKFEPTNLQQAISDHGEGEWAITPCLSHIASIVPARPLLAVIIGYLRRVSAVMQRRTIVRCNWTPKKMGRYARFLFLSRPTAVGRGARYEGGVALEVQSTRSQ